MIDAAPVPTLVAGTCLVYDGEDEFGTAWDDPALGIAAEVLRNPPAFTE